MVSECLFSGCKLIPDVLTGLLAGHHIPLWVHGQLCYTYITAPYHYGYMANCATPILHVWFFCMDYMCRTCVLHMYMLYMYYTCISTHVVHMEYILLGYKSVLHIYVLHLYTAICLTLIHLCLLFGFS